jgi:hypothetical protein
MAWQDPTEITVASAGEIFIAPVGTALPTTPTAALNAAFVGLGYVTEDGVTFTITPEIQEIPAWQSRQPVRRDLISQAVGASFSLLQWNETNVPFAFGGGTVTNPSGSIYRYELPTSGALDERAVIVDGLDGTRHVRFILPRCSVTDAVETQLVRTSAAVLPITLAGSQPSDGSSAFVFLTDDSAAFVAGS